MADSGFAHFVEEELFGGLPGVSMRKMFGGNAFYKDGVIFGMVINDTLYFKADETTKGEYEKRESKPFTYVHNKTGKTVAMPYWEVPAEVMDNPQVLPEWIEKAVEVGKRKNG